MKQIRFLSLLLFLSLFSITTTHAMQITLDFSSGSYGSQYLSYINQYEEDGFNVRTMSIEDQFSQTWGTYGPTLAWYENDVIIKVDYSSGMFDLLSIDLAVPAYAGLVLESSKGSVVTFGSITGTQEFIGNGWSDIDYFMISTALDFDILTSVDNFKINVNPVPEPSTLLMFGLGLLGLSVIKKNIKSRVRYRSRLFLF